MFFYYKVYGLIFQSNIEMTQLLTAPDGAVVDAQINIGKVPKEVRERAKTVKGETLQEASWFQNSRAYYYVTMNEILVEPREGKKIEEIIPFIQGYCFALFFTLRGMHAVHCSALLGERGVVLVAGYSGAGKSTISNKLLEAGYQLMADDVAVLHAEEDKVMVYPAFPMQKMCRDAVDRQEYDISTLEYIDEGRDKFAVKYEGAFDGIPRVLDKMIVLTKADVEEVTVVEWNQGNKLLCFIEFLFLRDGFRDLGFGHEQMQEALNIVSKMKVIYEIKRPKEGDTIEEILNIINKI